MRVLHVESDDWEGAYVDGKLFRQGHSLDWNDWLKLLGLAGVNTEHIWLEEEFYGNYWNLPETEKELKQRLEELDGN